MSIFRREPDPSAPRLPAAPAPPTAAAGREPRRTLIAAGTKITGEIGGVTDLQVDGELEGRIRLDGTVVIGAEGRVQGEIQARTVRVGGKVQGDVRGLELVELTASAAVEGTVSAARVIIAEGAFFRGKVEMAGGAGGVERPAATGPTPGGAAERPLPAGPPSARRPPRG